MVGAPQNTLDPKGQTKGGTEDKRETKEIRIRYPFDKKKKTDGTLQVKGSLLEIMLPIKTLKLERKNHNIDLKYQVDGNTIEYCVEEIK